MTTVEDIFAAPRDVLTVRRVFGDPIEKDGTLIIPVASVRGGAGGGAGTGMTADAEGGAAEGSGASEGSGGGFGVMARPVGVFVVRGDSVEWQPAVDATRVALSALALGALITLAIRSVIKRH